MKKLLMGLTAIVATSFAVPACADDAALILRFITDLAIYEKAEHEVKTDVAGIRDSLFGAGSTTHGLRGQQAEDGAHPLAAGGKAVAHGLPEAGGPCPAGHTCRMSSATAGICVSNATGM